MICTPKKLGRSDATTGEEQAVLEFRSKIKKKVDQLYRESPSEAMKVEEILPMLVSNGTTDPHLIKFPCDISFKLDGIRSIAKVDPKTGEVTLTSRGGHAYSVPDHIASDLLILNKLTGVRTFDGELYIHGEPLQTLYSCLAKHNEDTRYIKYHIFDVPNLPARWEIREVFLRSMQQTLVKNEVKLRNVEFVENLRITEMAYIEPYHLAMEKVGYEGVIIRNLEGRYRFNTRSSDVIKIKRMFDSEALVIDVEPDKIGNAVMVCSWTGITFRCVLGGPKEENTYELRKKLIGKHINFRYQQLTKDGIPAFPVGTAVRDLDNEGNPLV